MQTPTVGQNHRTGVRLSRRNSAFDDLKTSRIVIGIGARVLTLVRITIFQIKLAHTLIFWFLSLCVLYALFSGVAGRITMWTWVAVGLLLVESVVLAASGWTCPLTILAEHQGAARGSVSDIFLPKWLADRIFPICGTLYGIALLVILLRLVTRRGG